MSNILFLTSVYNFNEKGNLNVDLIDEFARRGHKITVMTPKERKYHPEEIKENHGNITCLQFRCLNFRGEVNLLEKGIATISLGYQYKQAWKKYFSGEQYDLIVYTTMPITYAPILKYLKKKDRAFCYLQQKDFFPQSAVDLGILRKGSFAYKLFRHIEKGLFKVSDKIGVISQKNIEFILNDNPDLSPSKVEVCPNSISPSSYEKVVSAKGKRKEIRDKYGIPQDAVVYLYGGNISRSQGIDFIKQLLSELTQKPIKDAFFLIIGNGNGYNELKSHIDKLGNNSITILPFMEKNEFDKILGAIDVGLVFLDESFTIANIPSRTLAHMDMEQPIIAATDSYTDYKDLIEDNDIGLWSRNGDVETTMSNIEKMTRDVEFRDKCGINSKRYLEEYANVGITYEVIMNSYKRA